MLPTKIGSKDVRLESKNLIFNSWLRINRYRLSHRLYRGGWSKILDREVMSRGKAVAVLPFDPVRQEVVLIEQFRAGAWAANWRDPWLIECIAGYCEPGENINEVAIREGREEAGCTITRLELMYRYFSSPGASTELVDLFCGQVESAELSGIYGLSEEDEDIYASAWPLGEALALLQQGRVCNAMTLVALQWLALNHQRISTKWTQDGLTTTNNELKDPEAAE